MSIELMYLTHNRREYVEATFEAMLENTCWDLVDHLHVTDDVSRDGTYELLTQLVRDVPVTTTLTQSRFGGPVAAMNYVIDRVKGDVLSKIDSDLILCPGWLQIMTAVLNANPTVDALGMEPGFGAPVQPITVPRHAKAAPFIGGIGLIRTRVFKRHRPQMDHRWFGWTQFQRRNVTAAWIDPDLPVFLLDHLSVEPWASLAREYVEKGWSRAWSSYFDPSPAYYEWWTRRQVTIA